MSFLSSERAERRDFGTEPKWVLVLRRPRGYKRVRDSALSAFQEAIKRSVR